MHVRQYIPDVGGGTTNRVVEVEEEEVVELVEELADEEIASVNGVMKNWDADVHLMILCTAFCSYDF